MGGFDAANINIFIVYSLPLLKNSSPPPPSLRLEFGM
jgi:hypothetical protein